MKYDNHDYTWYMILYMIWWGLDVDWVKRMKTQPKHMWLRFKCNHGFARVCARYFHFDFDAWGIMDLLCNKNEPFDFTLLNKQRLSKVFHPSWSVSPANAPRVAFARSSSFRHPTQSTRLNFSRSQWVNWQVSWAHANEPWLRAWAESAEKRNRTAGIRWSHSDHSATWFP